MTLKVPSPEGPPAPAPAITREEILEILAEALAELRRKARGGRIRDQGQEKIRTGKYRLIAYACSVAAAVLRDLEEGDLERRVRVLEEKSEREKEPGQVPMIKDY